MVRGYATTRQCSCPHCNGTGQDTDPDYFTYEDGECMYCQGTGLLVEERIQLNGEDLRVIDMNKRWTKETYRKFCKEINDDLDEDTDQLFDIAKDILQTEPGLKDYIIKEIGATDYVGRFVNDIC